MGLTTRLPLTGALLAEPLEFMRAGMPARDSVHQVTTFTPVAGGQTYQIIHTTEFDAYDPHTQTGPVAQLMQQATRAPAAIADALRRAAPTGDSYVGTDRKTAKLSIGTGQTERFADVAALIATLPSEEHMLNHTPAITTGSDSGRVAEEQRNVHVTGFLYAASREADNDFHLIVGRAVSAQPEMYMTMEVSGLPPSHAQSFADLNRARTSLTTFFGQKLPTTAYDYYHPPIPVVVEGSLFFDITHASGPAPGPASLKSRMPVIWEVHPVTSITLG